MQVIEVKVILTLTQILQEQQIDALTLTPKVS